jgi:hypothetical protein
MGNDSYQGENANLREHVEHVENGYADLLLLVSARRTYKKVAHVEIGFC